MPRTEHEPIVAVLGIRENRGGSVTSEEANGSVSCLPTGVLSDGLAPLKWTKSGMRLSVMYTMIIQWKLS